MFKKIRFSEVFKNKVVGNPNYPLILISLFLVSNVSVFAETKWVTIGKAQTDKVLKEFNYDKIEKSVKDKYKFGKESVVNYSMCQENFPELPGQFPCNFLTDEYSIKKNAEDVSSENAAGGKIGIRISKEKNILGGKVFLVGEDKASDGTVNEDMLQVYYLKNNYISHYIFKNQWILFQWKGKKGEETLVSILVLQFKNKEIDSLKRIKFQ
ncbi:MAG TPA: hypothetical protein PK079_07660 [Leptospiraceae bacterium]|nr:hypothetical protein [Leptospiraceae bacterium]HMW06017.1 hypothetical protein [Leptospiraceae bacterium]HMX32785.1 hypothetical protein [Leptospiraceae bacterium]HMY31441.1 hypothetical protein [Leptospiraceae bacterium]HMZ66559.1 hypothetical protein [Leptospiraceae bacterium]